MAHARRFRIPVQLPIVLALLALAALAVQRWRVDQRGDPEHLSVSGTVEGQDVALGSRVGGRLLALHVREGDRVSAGQLIAEFDAGELTEQQRQLVATVAGAKAQQDKLEHGPRQQELAQAAAAVATARAQLAALEVGTRQEDIASAHAAWRAAEAQYELAIADRDRAMHLYVNDIIPRSQLDVAETRVRTAIESRDSALAQYEKAQRGPDATQLDIARAQVAQAQAAYDLIAAGARSEDIAAAKSQVDASQAQLDALGTRLDEARVLAPSDGVVLTVNRQPGDLLLPGEPVANMLLAGSYYVQVFVPEAKLSWALPGTPCSLSVDAYPGEQFAGKVTFLATQGEYTPRNLQTKEKRVEQTFRCKVEVLDESGRLRPGMVCDVVFDWPVDSGG